MKKYLYYSGILILLIIIIILILSRFNITIINNIFNIKKSENLTTKLKSDDDFYEWFIEFDKLYKKKKGKNYPELEVNKDMFKSICDLLENKESKIYYKDGKYYVSDEETIELDVNSRSIRYIKYKEDNIIEILELRLVNGKYYIQLVNSDYLYRIYFNKNDINKITYKNKDNIYIDNDQSLFQTESFKW